MFDFEKALDFRKQLKRIAETQKISLKSDADWGYDRYLDHWRAGDKWRGRVFLEYAARRGSENALEKLIEFYSTDPVLRNPTKARYWKKISIASNSRPQLSSTEQKIVGAWSWTYIEGVGRIIFSADHKVRAGFPPEDKDGRKIGDDEFDIVEAGTWRLEGKVLVTEMDNRPLINMLEHLDPSNRPALEKKVERRKIVKIDDNKIVFDDGYSFDRVKR